MATPNLAPETATAKVNSNRRGGFDCEFVEAPPQIFQWECPLCLQVLREPYQAPCCGNSFCKVCIERIRTEDKPCPTCNEKNFTTFYNKGLQRTLHGFEVYCSHKQEGCEWKGELGQLDNHLNLDPPPKRHLEGCEYSEISCLSCTEFNKRIDIINLKVKDDDDPHCPKCPFSCEYCHDYKSNYEDVVKEHYPKCSEYPRAQSIVDPSVTNESRNGNDGDSRDTVRRRQVGANNPPIVDEEEQAVSEENEQQRDHPERPRQRENNTRPVCSRSRSCVAMVLGLALLVWLVCVLLYVFTQVDKCEWMQPKVQMCGQHCSSTAYSYECYCENGYRLNSDGKWKCDDIDECLEDTHQCAQDCHNTNGSYKCSCREGYTLNGDGYHCDDSNECVRGTHRCSQICVNNAGSYKCSCKPGYQLGKDGLQCHDIDECTNGMNKCEQHCLNTPGSYQCSCDSGYRLNKDGLSCNDINECTEEVHRCSHNCYNTVGSYTCSCNSGFSLNKDGFRCNDIDECERGTHKCEHICHNTEGSYTCTCYPRGHYYLMEDGLHCEDWREYLESLSEQERKDWFQNWLGDSTTLDILLTGKTGVGKSTLINGLLGVKVVDTKENILHADTKTVDSYSCEKNGVQIRVWDSPGLQDRSSNEDAYIAEMKRKCHSLDFVLYCLRMDETRIYNDDHDAILKLKNAFGKAFWDRTFFILTFANRVQPRKGGQQTSKEYFTERLNVWVNAIYKILSDAGIPIDVNTLRKRVIPAGFEELHLPDRRHWLGKLWVGLFEQADKKAQGSLLKTNLNRLIQEEKAKEKDFEEKEMHEQPIVVDKSWLDYLWSWLPFTS